MLRSRPSERRRRIAANATIGVVLVAAYGVALFEKACHPSYERPNAAWLFQQKQRDPRPLPFFPLSSYPMFSYVFDPPDIYTMELRGVAGGQEIVVPAEWFYPYWDMGMLESLENHLGAGTSAESYLVGLLALHEQRRSSGAYGGHMPQLDRLEIYLVQWDFDQWVRFRRTGQRDFRDTNARPRRHERFAGVSQ